MKSSFRFLALALSGSVVFAVGQGNAQPVSINSPVGQFTASTTTPWTTYSYTSPQLSVFSGVQFGNNQNTNISQNSAINISSLAQVGNNVSATVGQAGASNSSSIAQFGHNSSAMVYQFGH